jgi:hypothetical protein
MDYRLAGYQVNILAVRSVREIEITGREWEAALSSDPE